MIGYPIVFRCCECTVEEPNLEHLESHIWSRHFQKFPFSCTICDFPALNSGHLCDHFRQDHPDRELVQFKRALDDEKLLRKMVAESIVVQIFEEEEEVNHQTGSRTQNIPEIDVINLSEPQQIVLLPSGSDHQFENLEEPHDSDEDDFGLLEDDDNVEEIIEDDGEYLDELETDVYMGDEGHEYMEEEVEQEQEIGTGNTFHMKMLRQRRLEKTINEVASEGAIALPSTSRGHNPLISSNQPISPPAHQQAAKQPQNQEKSAQLQCDICGKKFKFASKLNEHKRSHLGDRPYSCLYCPGRFTQNGALVVHMRRHTGERPFSCQWECGKTFISSSAKRLHEKTHNGERQFTCWICSRSFLKKSHCTRHVKNIHGREISNQRNQAENAETGAASSRRPKSSGESGKPPSEQNDRVLNNLVNDVIHAVREEKFVSNCPLPIGEEDDEEDEII